MFRNPKKEKGFPKIFVTVGTTKFDLLAEYVLTDILVDAFKFMGCQEMTCQIGNSCVEPGIYERLGIQITVYRFKESIAEDIKNADLVISHAGAGSCIEVLEAQKPLLVVVNDTLMDNHQLQLARQLKKECYLQYCTLSTLIPKLCLQKFSTLRQYTKGNPQPFLDYIDKVFNVNPSE